MNLEYFQNKIHEELKDSCGYMKNAIEIKAMNSDWGKLLYNMSKNETEHASHLYKMANEYYLRLSNSYKEMPEYIGKMKVDIDDEYMHMIPKISALQAAYDKL